MKRPILFDQDAVLAALDTRKLTPKQKASRPSNVLPTFENIAGGKKKKTAKMYLYDAVSYWTGNDARSFQRMLRESDAEEIHLHINSPGGSVFEGVTIFNLLADHAADVIVHIDGLAASIASVIALAGDTVNIAENGMVMLAKPAEEEGQEEDPPVPPVPEFRGSLEDVQAAADRIAELRKLHGL